MKHPRISWFVSATLHGALLVYAFGVGFAGAPARVPPKVEVQALHHTPPPCPPAPPLPPVCTEPETRELELLSEPLLPVEGFEPPPPRVVPDRLLAPPRRPSLERIVAERAVSPPPEPPPPPAATPAQAPPSDRVAAQPLADNAPPRYPKVARRRGQQGVVVLRVLVDEHGAAAEVTVATSSGHELLDRAAADAVRAWRFRVARDHGTATADEIDVTVEFRLQS